MSHCFFSATTSDDQFGNSLLQLHEVLAHFTDLSPGKLPSRLPSPRGHEKEAPLVSTWSTPTCVQRKKGQRGMLRKYEVQAADRGQNSCYGRPGPSPSPGSRLGQVSSPSMWSDLSDQGGSRPDSRTGPRPDSRAGSRPNSRNQTCTSTGSAYTRDRLPKSAQQFPVLVQSGLSTSSMDRPSSQQGQHRDSPPKKLTPAVDAEEKPPFKHQARPGLFGKHFQEEMPDHVLSSSAGRQEGVVQEGRTSSVQPPESPAPTYQRKRAHVHLFESELQDDTPRRGETRSAQVLVPEVSDPASALSDKSANTFKRLGSQSRGSTEMTPHDPNMGIWSISLPSSKYDRMRRLRGNRKLKQSDIKAGDRDRVVSKDDVDRAEHVFSYWFGTLKKFNRPMMLRALCDFGIRAQCKAEKIIMFDIFAEHERSVAAAAAQEQSTMAGHAAMSACLDLLNRHSSEAPAPVAEFSFNQFCEIAEQARVRLRSSRFATFSLAWRELDTTDVGTLSHAQVLQLLATFRLRPHTPEEMASLETRMDELNKDASARYPLFEVEYLFQQCREHMEAQRRAAEFKIRQEHFMFRSAFVDSQDQIIDFHEAFEHFDVEETGRLGTEEVLYLLGEFGVCTLENLEQRLAMEMDLRQFLDSLSRPGEETTFTFPWFLLFVKTLREVRTEMQRKLVAPLYSNRAKDRKDDRLGLKEVCEIIEEMQLHPRTRQEQESLGEMLQDMDVDGSGLYSLENVLIITNAIVEHRAMQPRLVENQKAAALNLTRHQKFELRKAFESLDVDGTRTLSFREIVIAVQLMQWKVPESRIREVLDEVDEDKTDELDFLEFMVLMAVIDSDIKASVEVDRPTPENSEAQYQPTEEPNKAASSSRETVEAGREQSTGDRSTALKLNLPRRGVKPPKRASTSHAGRAPTHRMSSARKKTFGTS